MPFHLVTISPAEITSVLHVVGIPSVQITVTFPILAENYRKTIFNMDAPTILFIMYALRN